MRKLLIISGLAMSLALCLTFSAVITKELEYVRAKEFFDACKVVENSESPSGVDYREMAMSKSRLRRIIEAKYGYGQEAAHVWAGYEQGVAQLTEQSGISS